MVGSKYALNTNVLLINKLSYGVMAIGIPCYTVRKIQKILRTYMDTGSLITRPTSSQNNLLNLYVVPELHNFQDNINKSYIHGTLAHQNGFWQSCQTDVQFCYRISPRHRSFGSEIKKYPSIEPVLKSLFNIINVHSHCKISKFSRYLIVVGQLIISFFL